VIIRDANLQDAQGIAHVHVSSWRETYKGLLPDAYLANLSVEQRTRNWTRTFEQIKTGDSICVAETEDRRIVGFSFAGKNRNAEYDYDGEIYAIYLLKEFQGKGTGRKLFEASVERLRSNGFNSMMLWVLRDNPTLGFYKRMGGALVGEKRDTIRDQEVLELAVGWREL
jgi:GNAT superfamily N-acetyltransferase